jgi:hypothetical protein
VGLKKKNVAFRGLRKIVEVEKSSETVKVKRIAFL